MGSKRGSGRCFSSAWRRLDTAWTLIYSATRYDPELHSMVAKQGGGLGRWGDGVPGAAGAGCAASSGKAVVAAAPLNAGLLLLLVPFGNDDGTGNKSWLALPGGLFNLQPGEVVR